MKNVGILLLLALFLNAGCARETPRGVYYRTSATGKALTRVEYDSIKTRISQGMRAAFPDLEFRETLIDSTVTQDSIILTYNLDFGETPEPEKIRQYLGKQLPPVPLKQYPEGQLRLADLQGKPIWLNFWFTTCKPCIEEMPVMNRIRQEFGDRIHTVAITFEPQEKVEPFLQKRAFDFDHAIEAGGFIDSLGFEGFPKNLFLDREGVVRHIADGIPYVIKDGTLVMGEGEEFVGFIDSMLKEDQAGGPAGR